MRWQNDSPKDSPKDCIQVFMCWSTGPFVITSGPNIRSKYTFDNSEFFVRPRWVARPLWAYSRDILRVWWAGGDSRYWLFFERNLLCDGFSDTLKTI